MAFSPSLPAPSVVACKPDLSVDAVVDTHPPKLDILAQEERHDVPGVEPVVEMDSGEGQDLSMGNAVFNLPSVTLQSGQNVQREIQVGRANLRTFLTPSFKSLGFLSPIPEISPLSGKEIHGKPSEEICANVIDEIQRYPYRTALRAVEGGGFFFGKCGNAMDISMIGAESVANFSCLDYTMESSCLQLEGEATNKLESLMKANDRVEETAKKLGAEGEEGAKESVRVLSASPCFNSRKGLVPLIMEKVQLFKSPGNVSGSSMSALNDTYNLSHSQGSSGGQSLELEAGNITAEAASGVGPIAKEGSSSQASNNNTLVLHSGATVTDSNLTFEITEKSAVGLTAEAEAMGTERADLKEALELQSGEIVAQPNLTVDITEQSGVGTWSEDSTKSLGLKNGTFNVLPDHEPVAGPNLTVDLTTPNVAGPETGSTEQRAGCQNVTIELQSDQLNEPPAGINLTFNATKQLGSEDDPVGVCEAEGGAEGQLGSLTKVENRNCNFSQSLDTEDGGGASLWSLDTSLEMKANFLVTSTPLVVPKSFSFATKPAPSEACERLSVVEHSGASSDGNNSSAFPLVHQPPPAGAKPLTRSLTRPSDLPLKCGAKAQPSNRKSLACPSGIPNPKSLHPLPRPPSSRLSLAPPPKTASGLQVPGASSLLSSTLTRISRKTGGALRNLAASSSLEASVGSTTSRRRLSISENKLPVSGLQKPRTSGQLPSSSDPSLLALRPTGQTTSKLQTLRSAAGSRPLGLGEPKVKSTQLSTSSLKQPRANAGETLPLSKRKKVDTLAHATISEPPGSPAGSQRGLRRPASLLRGPQSKLQNLGGGRISGVLATKKSGPKAPLPPDVQPTAAQVAPPSDVSRPCDDDPGVTNEGAGTQATGCEDCARYREEIARLRAELQERDQRTS
ncbi:hypothetical protein ANANG_G00068950 [Anguilla anguilla]|uniref:Uncharacterized protein n=1 Tax=Anguilla anguilla TaxID=7936 RepID=A0A9D3MTH2_ANGAN|nr:hypothetical protein ANANG_G00068950 [Anguilla anguilla]